MAEILQGKLVAAYGMETTIPVLKLMEERDADLQMLGRYVYDNVFLNYTVKQWTLRPEQLDPHVTARVPVRISEDDRYFRDVHQAMPVNGYTHIFAAMLEHPNIRVEAGADYRALPQSLRRVRTVFTGPIDEYFGYAYGPLPYRSIRFEVQTLEREFFQEVGTVNYPAAPGMTCITEQKRLSSENSPCTMICASIRKPISRGKTSLTTRCRPRNRRRQSAPIARKRASCPAASGLPGVWATSNIIIWTRPAPADTRWSTRKSPARANPMRRAKRLRRPEHVRMCP